jgi:hypothetical protein
MKKHKFLNTIYFFYTSQLELPLRVILTFKERPTDKKFEYVQDATVLAFDNNHIVLIPSDLLKLYDPIIGITVEEYIDYDRIENKRRRQRAKEFEDELIHAHFENNSISYTSGKFVEMFEYSEKAFAKALSICSNI